MLDNLKNEFIALYKDQCQMLENYNQEYSGLFIAWFDKGFIKWKFANKNNLMLCDIYIKPEFRGQGYIAIYADLLLEQVQAYTDDIWFVSGIIQKDYKYAAKSRRIAKAYGMKLIPNKSKTLDYYMKKL